MPSLPFRTMDKRERETDRQAETHTHTNTNRNTEGETETVGIREIPTIQHTNRTVKGRAPNLLPFKGVPSPSP